MIRFRVEMSRGAEEAEEAEGAEGAEGAGAQGKKRKMILFGDFFSLPCLPCLPCPPCLLVPLVSKEVTIFTHSPHFPLSQFMAIASKERNTTTPRAQDFQ